MKKLLYSFFIAVCLGIPCPADGQIMTTIAGDGTTTYSGDGGPATSAGINRPHGVVTDNAGNIYIGDYYNFRVRKVSPSGIITTYAGNGAGAPCCDGGPATAAFINTPAGLTMYRDGSLYFAIGSNARVRKVSAAGIITAFAGNNTFAYSGDGGPATAAGINNSNRIAVDTSGNVYIAQVGDHRIRKVNAAGIISTFAGTGVSGFSGDGGPATAARLNGPNGVATDNAGNVYVADASYRVRKINAAGIISTVAGFGVSGSTGDGGPATAAQILPRNVAVDRFGNLLIAEFSKVRIVNPAGIISLLAGSGLSTPLGDGGPATAAGLHTIQQIHVDTSGNLYIADEHASRIRYVAGAICTGTPTAGTIASSVASDCFSYNLSLPGSTRSYGILYQWQSSPDGTSFSAIPSATMSTYAAGVSAPTHFRCVLTCANTGLSATTPSVLLSVIAPPPGTITTPVASICAGSSTNLTANPVGAGIAYQWLKDGFAITGGTNATYTATMPGIYTVVETNGIGCSSWSEGDTINLMPGITQPDTTICLGSAITLSHPALPDTAQSYNNFVFSARNPATSRWTIWRRNTITNNYQALFSDGYNRTNARVSEDGREMIYVKYRTTPPDGMVLLTMDSAWVCRSSSSGANEKVVFQVPQFNANALYSLDWSTDKTKIIYDWTNLSSLSSAPIFRGDIYMFDYATDLIKALTTPSATWKRHARFGPGDTSIAFTHHFSTYTLHPADIFKMTAAGTNTVSITSSIGLPTLESSISLLSDYIGVHTILYRRGYSGTLYQKSLGGPETPIYTGTGFGGIYLANGIYATTDTFNNIRLFHAGSTMLGTVNIPAITNFRRDPEYHLLSYDGSTLCWLGATHTSKPRYLWSTGDTTASITVTPTTNTTYYCTTTINGVSCTDTVVVATVSPLAPAITGDDFVCIGTPLTLSGSPTGGTWSCSNPNATVAGGVVTGTYAGGTTVSYTVTNECGTVHATHPLIVYSPDACPVSVHDLSGKKAGLSVLPNPSDGSFLVTLDGYNSEPATITIVDMLGRTVCKNTTISNRTNFDLKIPSGNYLVKITTRNTVHTANLVVRQ